MLSCASLAANPAAPGSRLERGGDFNPFAERSASSQSKYDELGFFLAEVVLIMTFGSKKNKKNVDRETKLLWQISEAKIRLAASAGY
jgi:hypothetical protein